MKLNPSNPNNHLDVPFRAPASSLGAQLESGTPPDGIVSTVAWQNLPLPKEEESLSRPRRDPYEASREANRRESIKAAGSLLKKAVAGKAAPKVLKLVPKTGLVR